MATIFGFNEAAAVAAWTGFSMFSIGKNKKSKATIALLKTFTDYPTVGIVMSHLSVILNVLSIFYFTQNTPADSMQLIAGLVLFLAYNILGKIRHSLRNTLRKETEKTDMGRERWVFILQWLCGAGFLVAAGCVALIKTGLFYVPLITFSIELLLLGGQSVMFHWLWVGIFGSRKSRRLFQVVNDNNNDNRKPLYTYAREEIATPIAVSATHYPMSTRTK
jgi:hypothetical protein